MHSLRDFEGILSENVPLARLTSFRTGGPARYLFEPRNEQQLCALFEFLSAAGIPRRILGAGTNVLAPDEGYAGAVVRLAGGFAALAFEGRGVSAGAAVPLGRFVQECAKRGLAGAECLAGIPGTLGGALVMNAGGRHGTIADLVRSVRALGDGAVREFAAGQIQFAYRRSSLAGKVLLSARLELETGRPDVVEERTRRIIAEKRAAQPLSAASAGCVFANPADGPAAGELIEKAGLKGERRGGAAVSELHANYIVNTGAATSGEVLDLIETVKSGVRERFGVDLELEIELW